MDSDVLPKPRTPKENKDAADAIMERRRQAEINEGIIAVNQLGAEVAAGVRRLSIDDYSGVDRTSVPTPVPTWEAAGKALKAKREAAAKNRL